MGSLSKKETEVNAEEKWLKTNATSQTLKSPQKEQSSIQINIVEPELPIMEVKRSRLRIDSILEAISKEKLEA